MDEKAFEITGPNIKKEKGEPNLGDLLWFT